MKQWFFRFFIGIVLVVGGILFAFSVFALVRERDAGKTAAPDTGTFISAGDVELFVQTAGDKKNPPIMLVHGMAAWSETWRPVMEMLAERGWYVLAVDMPPFGFSERPEGGDFWRTAQAHRLNALLDTLAIQKITIVGHSYGSRSVLETAMRYPERVQALVLVDPALSGIYSTTTTSSGATTFLVNAVLRYPIIASTMTNPFLSRFLLAKFIHDPADASDEILNVYRRPATLRASTEDLGAWLRGFMTGKDMGLSSDRENYSSLKKVALIWGEEDTTTPLAQGEQLQKMIPKSTLVVIPNVGHIPQIEDTPAFNKALLKALASVSQ